MRKAFALAVLAVLFGSVAEAQILGEVFDFEGSVPLEGAMVDVYHQEEGQGRVGLAYGFTDSRGHFEIWAPTWGGGKGATQTPSSQNGSTGFPEGCGYHAEIFMPGYQLDRIFSFCVYGGRSDLGERRLYPMPFGDVRLLATVRDHTIYWETRIDGRRPRGPNWSIETRLWAPGVNTKDWEQLVLQPTDATTFTKGYLNQKTFLNNIPKGSYVCGDVSIRWKSGEWQYLAERHGFCAILDTKHHWTW